MKAFFHPAQNGHDPQTYFSRGRMRQPQEVPARSAQILAGLEAAGIPVASPPDRGARALSRVHDLGYLRFLEAAHRRWHDTREDWGDEVMSNIFVRTPNAMRGILAEAARYLADGSCPVGAGTWQAAYWSAQSALAAASTVADGAPAAYAVCRPPGHHARRDAAGGFCYLNNAAIAAQHLQNRYARLAILDTDMHHGQGTQDIFYRRDDVLYCSIHGDPTNFYPVVSGFENETGQGQGRGYNINLPMPHGASEAEFFARLEDALCAIALYQPEALVLSLGFDIYTHDPQSKVSVSSPGFSRLGARIRDTGLPTVVVQEGGYHLETLSEHVQAFFGGLGGPA